MNFFRLILGLMLIALSVQIKAIEQLEVQALMPGMVVLMIDGSRTTLKTGEQSSHGVKMISSTSNVVLLEINGQRKNYRMGTSISTNFTARKEIREQVIVDNYGMFRSHGSINGQSVKFLIDTGASSVSMSARDARKLGIQYRLIGRPITTHTASGVAKGWALNLKTVRLKKLVEKNVEGVVVDGDYPKHILLGMSFLNRMKVLKEGNKMTITQKQ